jgi:hypothetical protein
MSSSNPFRKDDTVSCSITEPVVINGREHFVKFSTTANLERSDDPQRVIAATLQGLSDLIGETIAARSNTAKSNGRKTA